METKGKYWTAPNDGANWKCDECKVRRPYNEVYLIQTPNGDKSMLCHDCLDEDWKSEAEYLGEYKMP